MGLVLTRKDGQGITIKIPNCEDIKITLVKEDNMIRLNIDAPREYQIYRDELLQHMDLEEK